ncbi:MAG: hypothetical protein MR286_05055 [Clostridiales bacterium]|nr:hypothetical protein [Clostridiales bacterium]
MARQVRFWMGVSLECCRTRRKTKNFFHRFPFDPAKGSGRRPDFFQKNIASNRCAGGFSMVFFPICLRVCLGKKRRIGEKSLVSQGVFRLGVLRGFRRQETLQKKNKKLEKTY